MPASKVPAKRLLLLVTVGVTVCLPVPVGTHASAPSASLKFSAPKSTTLGEPVIMTATLYNTTGFRIVADFGVDDQTKFTFRQTKPDGSLVRVEPSLPVPRMRTSRLVLRDNFHAALVVLDEWMDLADVGVHRIDVEFRGAVGFEAGNEASVKRTARLSVEVKPRNPRQLEKRAAEWLKQVSTLSPGHTTRAARAALISMKDPVVIPYLELATSRTRSQAFADALGTLIHAEARASLDRLAASADPEVRAIALRAIGR